VRLQEIAEVSINYTLPGQVLVVEGAAAVRINAAPIDGGNIRQMSADIRVVLEEARAAGVLPADTVFDFYLDPAEFINRSIRNVIQAAVIGALLAMVIVLITLGEFRNTLLIGISLPVTLILSFILMGAFEVSLNLISLGGIALAVGMVIDSSIVVIENIHRHYEAAESLGDRPAVYRLIVDAVAEVRSPVIASTITTVLVFLPITFTAPLANAILGDQASTVMFALLFALLVSLTVVPVLAGIFYRPRPGNSREHVRRLARLSSRMMGALASVYSRALRPVVVRRRNAMIVIGASFVLLIVAIIALYPRIPQEIISPPSSDRVVVFFRSSTATDRVAIVESIVPALEARIRARVGDDVTGLYALVSGRFNIMFITLTSPDASDRVIAELEQELVSDNDFYYNVSSWDPAQLPLPRTNDLQISVRGDDDAQRVLLLEEIRDLVNETELYGRVFTEPATGLSSELVMSVRPEIVAGFADVTEESIVSTVRQLLQGTSAVEFEEAGESIVVRAAYPDEFVSSQTELENVLIATSHGFVPLHHFVSFREEEGVAGIASEDGERIFRVYAGSFGRGAGADRLEREATVRSLLAEELTMPPGYQIVFENPQSELDEAIRSLLIALATSIALVYLVVAIQFNSLWIPIIILVTVPLGLIGVIVSLLVFDSTVSLNSMLGTILLGGIVVNNAILMIDFFLKRPDRRSNPTLAILEAARLRFPPILITMLTTILGMLPLAIGFGGGSNIVQPLGIAVSGGFFVSTGFTLFVIPALLKVCIRDAGVL
jgi:HAE1 family hydrophobic/amphiphilic exporter-1